MRVFINVRSFSSGQPVSWFLFPPFSIEGSGTQGCGSIVTSSQTSSDCHNQDSDLIPMSRLSLLSLTVVGTSVKSQQTLPEVGILSIPAVLVREALLSPSSWRIFEVSPACPAARGRVCRISRQLCLPSTQRLPVLCRLILNPDCPVAFQRQNNVRLMKSAP